MSCKWLWIVLLMIIIKDSSQGIYERMLLLKLLDGYNVMERPVESEEQAVNLTMGMTLQQIIDVNEKEQTVYTNVWLTMSWTDNSLQWEPKDYGNVTDVRIHPKLVWKPDILMYNSADENFDATYHTNVVVEHTGLVSWIPPGMFKSTCTIDITWFPFDTQRCDMKFGSWTYDGTKISLNLVDLGNETYGGDTASFMPNGEWDLLGVPAEKHSQYYTCCPDRPYEDVTFTIHIRRRTLYYGFNLIIPCMLISSMSLLGFTLPPDSGEKLTLGVTILLSLTVFLLLVAENMPPTSDAVPLIGAYFSAIMMMVSLSVLMTVWVLNLHHRTGSTYQMPRWMRVYLNGWVAWFLRMERPGKSIRPKKGGRYLKEMELKDKSSKSLLANVLDMDDDVAGIRFQHNHNCAMQKNWAAPGDVRTSAGNGFPANHTSHVHSLPSAPNPPKPPNALVHSVSNNPSLPTYNPRAPLLGYVGGVGGGVADVSNGAGGGPGGNVVGGIGGVGVLPSPLGASRHSFPDTQSTCQTDLDKSPDTESTPFPSQTDKAFAREMQGVLKEVRYITDQMRSTAEDEELTQEWKFAGMVLDRICLWVFVFFTLASTGGILGTGFFGSGRYRDE